MKQKQNCILKYYHLKLDDLNLDIHRIVLYRTVFFKLNHNKSFPERGFRCGLEVKFTTICSAY